MNNEQKATGEGGRKKVVSPFEFYFMSAYCPDKAKNHRAETREEQAERRQQEIHDFLGQIKIK